MGTAGLDTYLYELYDPSAEYKLTYNDTKSTKSKWEITVGSDKNTSTYVTNYGDGSVPTKNTTSQGLTNVNYDGTRVYFAVRLKAKAKPDVVVIDYGLPVEIDVLANDDFAKNAANKIQAAVTGIDDTDTLPANGLESAPADTFVTSEKGSHGTLVLNEATSKLTYTPSSMNMPSEDVFVYAAKDTTNGRYYYSTVTVIPATSIYYEDGFVIYALQRFRICLFPLTA